MKKTFLVSILSFSFFLFMGVLLVQASSHTGGNSNVGIKVKLDNPLACGSNCTLFTLLRTIIDNIILPIGGVLAVLAFIYAGFLYVTAQGDTKKISNAHRALLYAAVGTAVLLGSWVIAQLIENTINQLR